MAAMGSSQKDAQAVSVLVLPLLFTTGMSLIDTLDGIFMMYVASLVACGPGPFAVYNCRVSPFVLLMLCGAAAIGISAATPTAGQPSIQLGSCSSISF